MITFQCRQCNGDISIEDSLGGHEATCEKCGKEQFSPLGKELVSGNLINDYAVGREIGEGSMGRVFAAHHLMMNREVALKVLKGRPDNETAEQFLAEMQATAGLEHPNIVSVYDAGDQYGISYIVMQFLKGKEVKDIVNEETFLSEKETLRICQGIARAMDYAWKEKRVIHRDLKPENIFITELQEIKVMDFGLAKITQQGDSGDSYDGLIVGTPDFMSPEQGRGGDDVDFRSDIYSCGILMIYMLTGIRPFHSESPMEVVAKHLTEKLPELEELKSDVQASQACRDLIQKMTRKDRNERFQTWSECLEEIDRAIESSDAPAVPQVKKKKSTKKVIITKDGESPSKVKTIRRKKKKGGILKPIFIMVVLIAAILAGSWFILPKAEQNKLKEKFEQLQNPQSSTAKTPVDNAK